MKTTEFCDEIYKKYQLRDSFGKVVDKDREDTFARVARAIAEVELSQDKQEEWREKFLWALRHGAIPAGRVLSNAGAMEYKPATSTVNCTVSCLVEDSIDGIMQAAKEAAITLHTGAGIGYCFSTLRPKGAYVSGAGSYTSGPLSFMDIFDKMCATISSAGGRRGAQMATLHCWHPDVLDFIRAKRELGRFSKFNLSVLITDEFVTAVEKDGMYPLFFPIQINHDYDNSDKNVQLIKVENFPFYEDEYHTQNGMFICKVYKEIKARELWDLIMSSTYDQAEPGVLFVDKINRENNLNFCEDINATNPCGEQPLPEYGACLLGSINLTKFVQHPFTDKAFFDWTNLSKVTSIFTRMLDNVVEINGLPLPEQREEITRKRRHGMGILGLGSALTMLRIRYGSPESVKFTEEVTREIALVGWRTGVVLALEKGPAPIMEDSFKITEEIIQRIPEIEQDGYRLGNILPGKFFIAKYSKYMQRLREVDPGLVLNLEVSGCRFTHHTSIAPTGTIAIAFANNASNGIEPSFAHQYSRNVVVEGRASKEAHTIESFEFQLYKSMHPGATIDNLPDYFVTASEIPPREHVDVQAAAQYWVDSSISKTINVPQDFSYEDFKDIYLYAYQKGLKGCTTFRYNPTNQMAVLSTDADSSKTQYKFTTRSGKEFVVSGNEKVKYNNEITTGQNLYSFLKVGS